MMVVCANCDCVELEIEASTTSGYMLCAVCQGKEHHDKIPREKYDPDLHGDLIILKPN